MERKNNTPQLLLKDGKYAVVNKARGTAIKPGQRKRPRNKRAMPKTGI
jgi:hypothetical protein